MICLSSFVLCSSFFLFFFSLIFSLLFFCALCFPPHFFVFHFHFPFFFSVFILFWVRGGVVGRSIGSCMQHNGAGVPLHQLTASAVGNTPEKDLDMVKEGLLRGIMHADERLFEFKARGFLFFCWLGGWWRCTAYVLRSMCALLSSSLSASVWWLLLH